MGGRKQMLAMVLAVMAVVMPGAGHTCPEWPKTTWELAGDADLIVVGRIVRTWEVDSLPADIVPPSETEYERVMREALRDIAPRDRVDLEVREVWKGAPLEKLTLASDLGRDDLVRVSQAGGQGDVWLLFLDRYDDALWRVTGIASYHRLEDGAVTAWRERVKRALELQAHPPVHDKARQDWNALALLHPATRWDGFLDLFDEARLWSRDDDETFVAPQPSPLGPVAQRRIAASFIEHPGEPSFLPAMLLVLAGHPSPEVDRIAIRLLEKRLAGGHRAFPISWTQDAMDLLSVRLGVSGPGTERCSQNGLRDEEAAAIVPCVRARWERIRALHQEQAR
ncbi:hypothetical protein ACLESO_29335 [Pyxidicoccus sp. 3LG]